MLPIYHFVTSQRVLIQSASSETEHILQQKGVIFTPAYICLCSSSIPSRQASECLPVSCAVLVWVLGAVVGRILAPRGDGPHEHPLFGHHGFSPAVHYICDSHISQDVIFFLYGHCSCWFILCLTVLREEGWWGGSYLQGSTHIFELSVCPLLLWRLSRCHRAAVAGPLSAPPFPGGHSAMWSPWFGRHSSLCRQWKNLLHHWVRC